MEQKLLMSDGTEFGNGSHAIKDGDTLYVYVNGYTLADVFNALIDKDKTREITYILGKVKLVFEGYTKLIVVRDEGTFISAILQKEGEADAD